MDEHIWFSVGLFKMKISWKPMTRVPLLRIMRWYTNFELSRDIWKFTAERYLKTDDVGSFFLLKSTVYFHKLYLVPSFEHWLGVAFIYIFFGYNSCLCSFNWRGITCGLICKYLFQLSSKSVRKTEQLCHAITSESLVVLVPISYWCNS